jgi:hypothetical protein
MSEKAIFTSYVGEVYKAEVPKLWGALLVLGGRFIYMSDIYF